MRAWCLEESESKDDLSATITAKAPSLANWPEEALQPLLKNHNSTNSGRRTANLEIPLTGRQNSLGIPRRYDSALEPKRCVGLSSFGIRRELQR